MALENNDIFLTIIIALFGAMIFIYWINSRYLNLFGLWVLRKWLKLIFFCLCSTILLDKYLLPESNIITLIAISASIYFLMESLVYWIEISAVNVSGISPFGKRYIEVDNAWLADRKYLFIKDKIQEAGFKRTKSYKIEVVENLSINQTVFFNHDKTQCLAISFIPYMSSYLMAMSITSYTKDNECYITQSEPSPSGLYYPKEYSLYSNPLISNPLKLIKIHNSRIKNLDLDIFDKPIDSYITQVKESLIKENLRLGIINQNPQENGFFTSEGKYHIWKNMIKINYIPFL